jgi:hypothetical protein
MMHTILTAAAISGLDFARVEEIIGDIESYTNANDYQDARKLGDVIREATVMNVAIMHEKLRVHFSQEDSMKVLCALLAGGNGQAIKK